MSTLAQDKAALFEAYGDDAEAAVQAMPNAFPNLWRWWSEHALLATYRRDVRTWRRRRKVVDARITEAPASLFGEPKRTTKRKLLRHTLETASGPVPIEALAGGAGAEVLRSIAERDRKPAITMLDRCSQYERLAAELEAAAERGETLTVAEILARHAA